MVNPVYLTGRSRALDGLLLIFWTNGQFGSPTRLGRRAAWRVKVRDLGLYSLRSQAASTTGAPDRPTLEDSSPCLPRSFLWWSPFQDSGVPLPHLRCQGL